MNTDDEDNEEKDVVEIHKSIINEKLRTSVILASAVPEGLVRKKNQNRRKAIVKKSINQSQSLSFYSDECFDNIARGQECGH